MMNTKISLLLNPFQRIAGTKALLFGLVGLLLAVILCFVNHLHFNGIGQFGIRYENATFLPLLLEHLIVWLVPAILFYIAGKMLSSSRIRFIDVLGTILFAQLPFIIVALSGFIPAIQQMMSINEFNAEIVQNPEFVKATLLLLLFIPFMAWSIVWMFQAYKTSCNLKGVRLALSFAILIILSDLISRIIIFQLMLIQF